MDAACETTCQLVMAVFFSIETPLPCLILLPRLSNASITRTAGDTRANSFEPSRMGFGVGVGVARATREAGAATGAAATFAGAPAAAGPAPPWPRSPRN